MAQLFQRRRELEAQGVEDLSHHSPEWRNQLDEERLLVLREDLAEWLSRELDLQLTEANLMDELRTGAVLCTLARHIEAAAATQDTEATEGNKPERPWSMPLNNALWRDTARKVGDGKAKIRCFQRATPSSFQARDNVANFLKWCSGLGLVDFMLFESNDLVEEPSQLVQLEIEIDKEEFDGNAHEEAVRRLSYPDDDPETPVPAMSALSLHDAAEESASSVPVFPADEAPARDSDAENQNVHIEHVPVVIKEAPVAANPRLSEVSLVLQAELTQQRPAHAHLPAAADEQRDTDHASAVSPSAAAPVNIATRSQWTPPHEATDEYVRVDLRVPLLLTRINLEAAISGATLSAFMLEASLDGQSWQVVRPDADADADVFEGGETPFAQRHAIQPPTVVQQLRLWPVEWNTGVERDTTQLTLRLELEAVGHLLAAQDVHVSTSSREHPEMQDAAAWLGSTSPHKTEERTPRENDTVEQSDAWWPAGEDAAPWVELRFGEEMRVGAVRLRAGLDEDNRVHAFAVHVQPLGEAEFTPLCDTDGSVSLFMAGADARTVAAFALPPGVTCEAIRIVAVDWSGRAAMAVDVLAERTGCPGLTAAERAAEEARLAHELAQAEAAARTEAEEAARVQAESDAREHAAAAALAQAEADARTQAEAEAEEAAQAERERLTAEALALAIAEAEAEEEAAAMGVDAGLWAALLEMLEPLAQEVKTEVVNAEKLKHGVRGCIDMPVSIRDGLMAQLLQDTDDLEQGVVADCDELTRQLRDSPGPDFVDTIRSFATNTESRMQAVQKACEDLMELVDEVDDEGEALASASQHWRLSSSYASAEALEMQLAQVEELFPEDDGTAPSPSQLAVAASCNDLRRTIARREELLSELNALGKDLHGRNVALSEAADSTVTRVNDVLEGARARLDTLLRMPADMATDNAAPSPQASRCLSRSLSEAADMEPPPQLRRVSRRARPVGSTAATPNWSNIHSRVEAFNNKYAKMKARERRLRRFRMPRYSRLDFSNVKSRIDTSMPKSMREMVRRKRQGADSKPAIPNATSAPAIDLRHVNSRIDTNLSRRASEMLVRRASLQADSADMLRRRSAERLKDPVDDAVAQAVKDAGGQNIFRWTRVGKGKYLFDGADKAVFVRQVRLHVMVRTGGGWDTLAAWLAKLAMQLSASPSKGGSGAGSSPRRRGGRDGRASQLRTASSSASPSNEPVVASKPAVAGKTRSKPELATMPEGVETAGSNGPSPRLRRRGTTSLSPKVRPRVASHENGSRAAAAAANNSKSKVQPATPAPQDDASGDPPRKSSATLV